MVLELSVKDCVVWIQSSDPSATHHVTSTMEAVMMIRCVFQGHHCAAQPLAAEQWTVFTKIVSCVSCLNILFKKEFWFSIASLLPQLYALRSLKLGHVKLTSSPISTMLTLSNVKHSFMVAVRVMKTGSLPAKNVQRHAVV